MNLPLELSQIVGAAAEIEPALAQRPRILVAGEFSSGKTRLVNGLLGEALLPSSVTSTSLPPIWITHGEGTPECVGLDGSVQAFASVPELIAHVQSADVARIHHCRIPHPSPVLRHFDLIDTPGSSDPNIPSLCWERMVEHADMIVWCSTSVQAWRQSEKSTWLAIPEEIAARSLLVLSHADRLIDPADREKVLRRVTHEAEDFFASIRLASFVSETDLSGLLADLCSAAAGLPTRPARPFAPPAPPAEEAPRAEQAVARVVPRRIRLRSDATGPLLLVTRASDADAPVDEAPAPAADLAGSSRAELPAPDVGDAGTEAAMLPAAPHDADEAGDLSSLIDLESLAGVVPPAAEAPLPAAEAAGGDEGFLALLRGAIEAVDDLPEAEEPALAAAEPAGIAEEDEPCETTCPAFGAQPAADRDGPSDEPAVQEAQTPATVPRVAPQPAPMIFGPARMLWAQILPTLDCDDPDQLLDGIEQLVAELDLTFARACLSQAPAPVRRRGGAAKPA